MSTKQIPPPPPPPHPTIHIPPGTLPPSASMAISTMTAYQRDVFNHEYAHAQ